MKRDMNSGASLLELLLALGVFMTILPFIYNFAMDRRKIAENIQIIKKIEIVRNALEEYITENKQKLLEPVTANVVRIKLSDLKNVEDITDKHIQLRIVKSKDVGGHAFLQGVVIFDSKDMTPLRTRQIAMAGGNETGFADGKMLYGSFGTWRAPMSTLEARLSSHSVLSGTRTFRNSGDYLQRLPSEELMDATMNSNLNMGGHDIENIKNIWGNSARFLDGLSSDSIEATKMSVLNRIDWASAIDVFGDAVINGSITSDGMDLDASEIYISGKSHFRNVTSDSLYVDNLYLSGFSVRGIGSEPAIMSISGALDMTRGYITAMDTFVEFSGSVTPKLVVTNRIEDSKDPNFYWNLGNNSAVLGDLYLSTLAPMMKEVYLEEKTGNTETERLMQNVIQNSNATIADYIKALGKVEETVMAKYNEIKSSL